MIRADSALASRRRRLGPRRHQAAGQALVRGAQVVDEQAVDPRQPGRVIQIFETQAVREAQFGHHSSF